MVKKFFEEEKEKYSEYAKMLEPKIGIPHTVLIPLISVFIQTCIDYAVFEDENRLKSQLEIIKQSIALFSAAYKGEGNIE